MYVLIVRMHSKHTNTQYVFKMLVCVVLLQLIVWLLKAKKGSNVELIGIVTILVSKYVKCFTL